MAAYDQGLIQRNATKYLTQVGQLRTMSRNMYGDYSETTVNTVNCLVYTEERKTEDQAIADVAGLVHKAILPINATYAKGDHLSTVVDLNGETVLADSRIVEIRDYNHWRYGSRFKEVYLDIDLS